MIGRDVVDAPDRAAVVVDVVEVPVRADLDVDGVGRASVEGDLVVRIGQSPSALKHHPDAIARVVGEEERAVVRVRKGPARIEGETGYGRARRGRRSRAARLAVHDLLIVVVREVRSRDCACALA